MTDFRAYRSVLYLPAANARAVEKARTLAADAVILDLEDAVAADAKAGARAAAAEAVTAGGWGSRTLAIRVNGIGTQWCEADFQAVAAARPDAVVVPKVNSAAEAAEAVRLAGGVPVWAMIETPRGVQAVDAIADTPGVAALVVGAADLEKDLGCRVGPARGEIQYTLQRVVIAARAAGIRAFDAMYPDIKDMEGLETVTLQGRALGFDGKTLIHPAQIETANRVFSPSAAEVEQARRIVAAFEAAKAEGKGVATLDGKLVEVLHAAQARDLIAFAESIAAQ
ncbi:HpcH/HpaI aldolase/citrate lyase family protein [Sphingosinicella soli]|uniref:Citrate lyase beta subunit n=1 Tax=Sphingosinicella soli TaxID=333708 RepID=A0A7W7AZV2_9SPHN|nr:CoA ester lyase [Sphingosinicella soli]MBB4631426.1 citrate lyase beta subunit [Sphingosinicella soli]